MRDEFFEAKARHEADGANVICPYCKHEYQPEAEDYSEETRESECSECGKKYRVWQVFTVDHYSEPDCELNGEQHEWDAVSARKPDWQSCGKCDKWRKTPVSAKSELDNHGT